MFTFKPVTLFTATFLSIGIIRWIFIKIYIIICLPGLSHKTNLCVEQKNSAVISGDAEWNSTSSEVTEMHVWCCLSFLITEKPVSHLCWWGTFTPFKGENIYQYRYHFQTVFTWNWSNEKKPNVWGVANGYAYQSGFWPGWKKYALKKCSSKLKKCDWWILGLLEIMQVTYFQGS